MFLRSVSGFCSFRNVVQRHTTCSHIPQNIQYLRKMAASLSSENVRVVSVISEVCEPSSFSDGCNNLSGMENSGNGNVDNGTCISFDDESYTKFHIKFDFQYGNGEKTFNLLRRADEEVGNTFARIVLGVEKFISKKQLKKKKKGLLSPDEVDTIIKVSIEENGTEVDSRLPNHSAWKTGSMLNINDNIYQIHVDPPTCVSVKLPSIILSGYPIHEIDINLCKCDVYDCTFVWHRKSAAKKPPFADSCGDFWEEVATELHYIPREEDVGLEIRLCCIPRRCTYIGKETKSDPVIVSQGPMSCPFEKRHRLTTAPCHLDSFRVVSYNILANLYADSDYSRNFLFCHCPTDKLDFAYRKLLLLKEITGYNADVVCLQEVDRKFFTNLLSYTLTQHGYAGAFNSKPQDVAEGSAVFYKIDRFSCVGEHHIDVIETLKDNPSFADILNVISTNESFSASLFERKNQVQVMALESVHSPSRVVLACSTHFYWHPRANNVRNVTAAVTMRHLEIVQRLYEQQGRCVSIVLCGDFNSGPHTGLYDFITTGYIPSTHADWYSEGVDHHVKGAALRHSSPLVAASGTPLYTNYVPGFQGCLDYIFISPAKLKCRRVVPLPEHEDVTRLSALPNAHFPSDHLALVCDITWRQLHETANDDTTCGDL